MFSATQGRYPGTSFLVQSCNLEVLYKLLIAASEFFPPQKCVIKCVTFFTDINTCFKGFPTLGAMASYVKNRTRTELEVILMGGCYYENEGKNEVSH